MGKSTGFGQGKRPPLTVPNDGPGPGQYPVKSSIGESVKFGLRGRGTELKGLMNNPGPGAYDPAKTHTSPAYKIGTGKRSSLA